MVLTPNGPADEEEDPQPPAAAVGLTFHPAEENFQPLLVEALSEIDVEKVHFNKMRDLLANHLHYTYRRGELSWPRPRKEILPMYNEMPRTNFPINVQDLL